jgi:hypothetical protein
LFERKIFAGNRDAQVFEVFLRKSAPDNGNKSIAALRTAANVMDDVVKFADGTSLAPTLQESDFFLNREPFLRARLKSLQEVRIISLKESLGNEVDDVTKTTNSAPGPKMTGFGNSPAVAKGMENTGGVGFRVV